MSRTPYRRHQGSVQHRDAYGLLQWLWGFHFVRRWLGGRWELWMGYVADGRIEFEHWVIVLAEGSPDRLPPSVWPSKVVLIREDHGPIRQGWLRRTLSGIKTDRRIFTPPPPGFGDHEIRDLDVIERFLCSRGISKRLAKPSDFVAIPELSHIDLVLTWHPEAGYWWLVFEIHSPTTDVALGLAELLSFIIRGIGADEHVSVLPFADAP